MMLFLCAVANPTFIKKLFVFVGLQSFLNKKTWQIWKNLPGFFIV